jgi:hypothetical protein
MGKNSIVAQVWTQERQIKISLLYSKPLMNETHGRREKRRVHNAVGGTQAPQQQTVSFIHEG